MNACTVPDCARTYLASGLCGMHYQRNRKHGSPATVKRPAGNWHPRPVVTHRVCLDCEIAGPVTLFAAGRNRCLPCQKVKSAEWHRKNPEKTKAWAARNPESIARSELRRRAKRNGQDPDVIEAHNATHSGKCDICGKPPGKRDLAIDHDHATGAFRGRLCDNCNNGLGRFFDDTELLRKAANYLIDTTPRAELLRLLEAPVPA